VAATASVNGQLTDPPEIPVVNGAATAICEVTKTSTVDVTAVDPATG